MSRNDSTIDVIDRYTIATALGLKRGTIFSELLAGQQGIEQEHVLSTTSRFLVSSISIQITWPIYGK